MNEIECYGQCRELTNHDFSLFNSKLIGYTSDCNKHKHTRAHLETRFSTCRNVEMFAGFDCNHIAFICVTNSVLPSCIINMSKNCIRLQTVRHSITPINFVDYECECECARVACQIPEPVTERKILLFTTSPFPISIEFIELRATRWRLVNRSVRFFSRFFQKRYLKK